MKGKMKEGKMWEVGGKIVSSTAEGDKGIPPGYKSCPPGDFTKGVESSTPTGVTWNGQKGKPKSPTAKPPLD